MNFSPIAKPPWDKTGKQIESALRKAVYEFDLLQNSKISIALSGGKDSLTLLFMLHAISGRGFPKLDLSAVHVSGAFSCGAGIHTDYLHSICDQLEIPLIVKQSSQTLETLKCYSCSRERRRLLFEAAKSIGVNTIAFGHHKDDHTQTLLMNLLHKGEFAGNLPKIHMEVYGVTIIRPLIFVAENIIEIFAKQNRFARILCRCPVGQNSMRKQVKDLLEEMQLLFPNASNNLAQAGFRYGSDKASRK